MLPTITSGGTDGGGQEQENFRTDRVRGHAEADQRAVGLYPGACPGRALLRQLFRVLREDATGHEDHLLG